MKLIKIVILVASVAVTLSCFAAASLTPDLIKCANFKNEKQRLQCFDDYVAKNSMLKQDIAAEKDVAIVAELITKEAQSKENLVSSFGQAHRYSEKEREFDEMKSIIKSVKRNLHKKWKIELENGQVWIEKGGDKRAKFSEGDSIVIMRGIMNSFQLKKVGTKRRIRVHRVL